MSSTQLSQLYNIQPINEALKSIECAQILQELGADPDFDFSSASYSLRVAAAASFADFCKGEGLDHWLRNLDGTSDELENSAIDVFSKWDGYIDALSEAKEKATSDDLIFFSAAGLMAKRPNEVRHMLRKKQPREWVEHALDSIGTLQWTNRVRCNINIAILLIIRQDNHKDVKLAGDVLQKLSETQRSIEAEWLKEQSNQTREAFCLLGYYHLAQAVVRMSEFLLAGTVKTNGRLVADFAAELRRLLVRSEEFLSLCADSESLLWLNAVGFVLIKLRESSIWVQAKGISERIDQLVDEITRAGREAPVFSLLPSQQEALRQSLLDRSRVAIILQMPTSSGKTLLAEFSIAQTFDAYRGKTRAVYLVPTRALATQVRRSLTEDLGPLGIQVSAAGSAFEEDPYELHLLEATDGVVVATPEKLDLMLRSHPEWFSDLRLVVVDEAHLLGDSERGVKLELLLANLRREQPQARLLLLTPFMDNAKEIATWLSQSRGLPISIHWRPSRILLGLAKISGRGSKRQLLIEWTDPYNRDRAPKPLTMPVAVPSKDLQSNSDRIVFLAKKFQKIGTVLAMFSASPAEAEKATAKISAKLDILPSEKFSPHLRLAVALARSEYGPQSKLAYCLERGVAFHHSSLSSILRYLIEDQVRAKTISFVAATSTLAQGMNFPVASVLVHSVHKPYGGGNFSGGEFWNIAGRAGRVGMVEKGLVIFAHENHRECIEKYSQELSECLKSALLSILDKLSAHLSIKDQYREYPELRPFIQYLAHAVANSPAAAAAIDLEELLQQSLVNQQVSSTADSQKLRSLARAYLQQLNMSKGMLKTADSTGLGSFSFEQLYATLRNDNILNQGPGAILQNREFGISRLVDALRWLPELSLAIGKGMGDMDVTAVARVIQGWIDGEPVYKFANEFPGDDEDDRIRDAAKYVYGKVSQTVSWGAHAYLRGWLLGQGKQSSSASEVMLPSYIQYGVHTPEAAVASLLGVPRQFAQPFADMYRYKHGALQPGEVGQFKSFVEDADEKLWQSVVDRAAIAGVEPRDARLVVRQMQGLKN